MDKWPSKGPEFNEWFRHLPEFIAILEDAKAEGFWTGDFDLKYLTLRIDTRDNAWVLFVDGKDGKKEPINPNRVLAAIEKNRARFGKVKTYARMLNDTPGIHNGESDE